MRVNECNEMHVFDMNYYMHVIKRAMRWPLNSREDTGHIRWKKGTYMGGRWRWPNGVPIMGWLPGGVILRPLGLSFHHLSPPLSYPGSIQVCANLLWSLIVLFNQSLIGIWVSLFIGVSQVFRPSNKYYTNRAGTAWLLCTWHAGHYAAGGPVV